METQESEQYHGNRYSVLVSNVGTVFESDLWDASRQAWLTFQTYVDRSKAGYGRCAHESVTLFRNEEPIIEYNPEQPEDCNG